ncbi:MAG: hypothetical protein EOO11_17515 [Chitinophagaceae bacterium]|nr:MAG: hypothetical protein EOO11_17515 [Chitinophagaceae bacterium]
MPNYGHIVKNTDPKFATGGYKNVFLFCPRADFTALAAPDAAAAIGDTLLIDTAHTHPVGKGFISYACKTHSVTLKGATVGDEGAQEMEWTGEFVILGDSASTQEQLQRLLNDDVICLLKDAACGANQYVQLGDECITPIFKVEFDGKTTKEGKKEYKVTVTCKAKYFYNAAVSQVA